MSCSTTSHMEIIEDHESIPSSIFQTRQPLQTDKNICISEQTEPCKTRTQKEIQTVAKGLLQDHLIKHAK